MLKVVVLISGGGSNLKALLDAAAANDYPATIVAVGSDTDAPGLDYATQAGVPSFVVRPREFESREAWGAALAAAIREYEPALVVSAGLMRVLPGGFVREFSPRLINTHPALLPSFPGMHGPRDALRAGVKVSGATVFVVDAGVDTGKILLQGAVDVRDDDDVESLHERIKVVERGLLIQAVSEWGRPGLDWKKENP